ncbi:MAG: sensor signal transduction histidine kinase [Thermoleophilia bacterium]|nr:sensor signal transduction histidine kinase [Thermoleophilia bacterium]
MVVLEQLRLALRNEATDLRPHERESMLTRDNGSEIRAVVMLMFPVVVALMWPQVNEPARPWFWLGIAMVILLNILGWTVPWRRLPRWVESVPPLASIGFLWITTATTGGFGDGYGMLLVIPIFWIALYADTSDVFVGLLIAAVLVLPPTHEWFEVLPYQGTLAQRVSLVLLLTIVSFGIRPLVNGLRAQVRTSRRATYSLRASQAALAHDLRTPLTSMCALAELADQRLDDEYVDVEVVREYVRRISGLGWRAEGIIRGVLDLSRAAELLPTVESIDVRRLLEELAGTVDGVQVEIGDVPASVVGHEPSIRRLFANLFENAAVHGVGPEPSDVAHVEVDGSDQVGGWRFTVRDHGPGIASEESDAVFQPWRRGASARDGGHGLGLAIVAAIVEQHGGTIVVGDADPCGAAFTFTLSRSPRIARDDDEVVARSATGVPLA